MRYYVCDYSTKKVMFGPFKHNWSAAQWITSKPYAEQVKYCTMSRYLLAKDGIYPDNKAGTDAILKDLGQE